MAEVQKKQTEERDVRRRRNEPSLLSEYSPLWRSPGEFFSGSPFRAMRRMLEDMDRLFESRGPAEQGQMQTWWPAIEVSEHEGKLVVHADLPGLKKDDIKVELTDDGLVLRGERKREHEEEKEGWHRSERSYGSFYRLIPIPEGAKIEQAKAQFNDGVLEITIPIPEEQRRRREIPIETSGAPKIQPGSEAPGQQRQSKTG
jgi:HSP20 family protein